MLFGSSLQYTHPVKVREVHNTLLADELYPELQTTVSRNRHVTDHDGIFLVAEADLAEYMALYNPQVLRYNKTTDCYGYSAINFGDAKGLTFDRVLIFPHGPIKKFLQTGDPTVVQGSVAKFYVAIIRARYSVAFCYAGKCAKATIRQFRSVDQALRECEQALFPWYNT